MKQLAILNSEGLVGQEIKQLLAARRELWHEVRLLTADPDAVGTVTEGVDGAAFVQELSPETAEGLDIAVICPGVELACGADSLRGSTLLYVSPPHPVAGSIPVVAGVNLDQASLHAALSSPHPAVVALAMLINALGRHDVVSAACWVAQPGSLSGQQGIDELFEQTRSILSFNSDHPVAVFGSQLAFNLLPVVSSGPEIEAELVTVLGGGPDLSVQVVQAPVFHGLTIAVQARLGSDIEAGQLKDDLLGFPFIDAAADSSTLGPIDAAGRGTLLLGSIESSARNPRSFSISAVLDNLGLGTAGNAVAVIEEIVTHRS